VKMHAKEICKIGLVNMAIQRTWSFETWQFRVSSYDSSLTCERLADFLLRSTENRARHRVVTPFLALPAPKEFAPGGLYFSTFVTRIVGMDEV
jgi:hypothetical protein